jgi:hypothetical protein
MSDTEHDFDKPPRGAWARALWMADRTPESRNRMVDFLRALAILAVVLGHWVISAPSFQNGLPAYDHVLDFAPWSRWLTWLFQVMPLFFFVGGYANGVSWTSAERQGLGYAAWFDGRIRRLLGPVLPLVVAWGAMAAVARANGVGPGMVAVGSQVALVPVWFLAVYIMVASLVPWTMRAWRRWGMASVAVPALAAALVDVLFFTADQGALAWLNYPFVWLTVHQLGYAWRDDRLRWGWLWSGVGVATLVALTHLGPYPLSLVGVPSEEISNTLPPKLPLLALGAAQIGLVLALEGPARRWLSHRRPWAATIIVNSMIMTIFLWHSTVMMLLFGLGFWVLPGTLTPHPGSADWWWARVPWLTVFTLVTLPVVLLFARFERPAAGASSDPASVWRLLAGCVLACLGLAMLALDGVGGDGWLGLRWAPLSLPVIGSMVAGIFPWPRLR